MLDESGWLTGAVCRICVDVDVGRDEVGGSRKFSKNLDN